MFKRLLVAAIVSGFCVGVSVSAQTEAAKDGGKKVGEAGKETGEAAKELGKTSGEAAKDVSKETGAAAKDVGKDVGEGAKDVGKDVATTTKSTAKKVKNRVLGKKESATCNDGSTWTGKSRDSACGDHGGVKSWNSK